MLLAPATALSRSAHTAPLMAMARDSRSSCAPRASSPAPLTAIWPCWTDRLAILPSASKFGVPVVNVTRGAWMNEHPEQVIPAGLAMMRFARLPAISVGPASVDGLPLVTWFRMTRALLLPRNGLP